MAEHIDKIRLTTDIRYRFEYLSKFLNFTKEDINMLNILAPIIFPRIPFIVESVYKKLYTYDIIQNILFFEMMILEVSRRMKNQIQVLYQHKQTFVKIC
jgi:hypothetical protein